MEPHAFSWKVRWGVREFSRHGVLPVMITTWLLAPCPDEGVMVSKEEWSRILADTCVLVHVEEFTANPHGVPSRG